MRPRTAKCLSFVLSFALCLTTFSTVFSNDAYAASSVDSVIQQGDTNAVTTTCGSQDIAYSYAGLFSDYSKWDHSIVDQSTFDALSASWSNALNTGKWSLSQRIAKTSFGIASESFDQGDQFFALQWSESSSAKWKFYNDSDFGDFLAPATSINLIIFGLYDGPEHDQPCGLRVFVGDSNVSYLNAVTAISNTSNVGNIYSAKPVFINGEIQYPEDYSGVQPPTSLVSKPTIKPDFTYQLSDKKISAHDYGLDLPAVTPDDGYTIQGYSVEWSLSKCGSWDNDIKLCDSPSLKDHQILLQDKDYSFSVTDYGDYKLSAQYLVQECYRYPSYPATPDYCFYVDLGTEIPDYDFTSTSIYLKIDGTSTSGDTKDLSCDVSGFCYQASENCDLKTTFIDKLTCQFNNQFNVGILNPSLNAFKNLFNSFVVPSSPSCGLPLSNVAISAGHDFPLSEYGSQICSKTAQFHNSFPLASVIVNAVFGLSVLSMFAAIINKLTNNNDNDIVQGV